MNIPEQVIYILEKINQNGHEAYIVGGCVRDCLMGRVPNDWDITTSATPIEIKALFLRTYDTGLKHGTVTVNIDKINFEVTTYRIEKSYQDYRRPSEVSFTENIEEDLKRRDFTMNAIAYHPRVGFVDPFSGIFDIENGIIRCVGTADNRFQEDALRLLRAIRFACQLNFEIEEKTLMAIKRNKKLIAHISKERIREELNKILVSNNTEKFLLMHDIGMLQEIIPEFDNCFDTEQKHNYHIYDVGRHSLAAVKSIKKDLVLKWTMLLHDIGKPLCKTTDVEGIDHFYNHGEQSVILANQILRRLKFDNQSRVKIKRLIKWHDRPIHPTHKAVRKAMQVVGEELFMDLLNVIEADIKAQNPEFEEKRIEELRQIKKIYHEIQQNKQCVAINDLAINGRDLINIGIPQGREIGETLSRLLDIVVDYPEENNKERLLEIAKKMKMSKMD